MNTSFLAGWGAQALRSSQQLIYGIPVLSFALLTLFATCGCNSSSTTDDPNSKATPEQLAARARNYLAYNNVERAKEIVQQALQSSPDDPHFLELAGDVAAASKDAATAATYYEKSLTATEKPSSQLLDKCGGQWMAAGRPFKSLETLQKAVQAFPDDPGFRQKIVGMMTSLGLEHQAFPHLKWLVKRGYGQVSLMIVLTNLNRPQTQAATCEYALKTFPDDHRPSYSLARFKIAKGDWQDANDLLKPVVQHHPDFLPAQSYYLRTLVELDDQETIADWLSEPPEGVEEDSQYWLAAGIWASRQNQPKQAARAYWRSLQIDENQPNTLLQLAKMLRILGREDEAKKADARAQQLLSMRDAIDKLLAWGSNSQSATINLSQSLQELGRPWEATVWLQLAARMTNEVDKGLPAIYQQYRSALTANTPWQEPTKLVAAKLDLSELPSLQWEPVAEAKESESTKDAISTKIRFADQAEKWNLHHVCKIGDKDGKEGGMGIYQTVAGGVGAIDFDLDGWPDLYFSNSSGEPLKRDSETNRLFRNMGGKYSDVTEVSKTNDSGFAQGITVGDYNDDGFPDLFVGNIGDNLLLRNNGDGSFTNVTQQAGLTDHEWTTSAAFADLNGDGYADLFQLSYCDGDAPYRSPCISEEINEPRACTPIAFDARRDRVYKGLGDGTFVDETENWLSEHQIGFGLGLVVGTLDDSPGLDVFVANDTTANHYWSPSDTSRSDGSSFSLTESGTIRGLAFSGQSIAQGSMGVAAGDPDNDGDVDFYVTHMRKDYNTFYQQVRPGMWSDNTSVAGLFKPTFHLVGFGTQWIDADNDMSVELIVGNGHIDDFSHRDVPFRMPTQLFQQTSGGKWVELPRKQLGDFFTQDRLTRAIALLDVNRDGLQDAIFANLYDPVTLLVNQTKTSGNSLRLFLRRTKGQRDSIGARVRYRIGEKEYTAQLFSGDGYYCSNERCIHIPTGDHNRISDVRIQWSHDESAVQRMGELEAGSDYLVLENDSAVHAF